MLDVIGRHFVLGSALDIDGDVVLSMKDNTYIYINKVEAQEIIARLSVLFSIEVV